MTYDAWMTKCHNIPTDTIISVGKNPVAKICVSNGTISFSKEAHDYIKDIDRVEFHPPATVLITKTGKRYVSVAQNGDTFDKETGVEQCLLQLVFDGKQYHNAARDLVKKADRTAKEKEKAREEEKRIQAKREKEIAEKRAKRAEKERKQREYEIEVQKEAYLRALKEFKDCKN